MSPAGPPSTGPDISVVVVGPTRGADLGALHRQQGEALRAAGLVPEFIFLVDAADHAAQAAVGALEPAAAGLQVVRFSRGLGTGPALARALRRARARAVAVVPAAGPVEPAEVARLASRLDPAGDAVLVARRLPHPGPAWRRLWSRVHGGLIRLATGIGLGDVTCGVWIMPAPVARELDLHGDLAHLLPLLAHRQGFPLAEVPVRPGPGPGGGRTPARPAGVLLDLLALLFLFRFTRQPLRFFGLPALLVGTVGAGLLAFLGVYRLLRLGPLAGRPLLVLAVLLVVFAIQLLSIGLLGELLVFLHARAPRDREVEEVLE